jgi:hypothetical protein
MFFHFIDSKNGFKLFQTSLAGYSYEIVCPNGTQIPILDQDYETATTVLNNIANNTQNL